ncbi:11934_t:CDS:10 [Diversispora eburnea]|uniref:AP-1 complex subunit gamma n=1 Tax=Diversispora eburnea TaxID=1213867 RepID=A0A9N8YQH5_9GLOM|nr:11934_t:CDS:10 [Diversispora eburnea]
MPYYRLKDLIKAIRACKTAADERAVIQKESAAIRTSFKEENNDSQHSNVAKLLYIHMLGYPAHFGQIECLKLVASNRFADKRLGYLGIMLLLDENQEVLTDMNHSNMYIVGLALCTLGNISSPEMAGDLCTEVEKNLASLLTFLKLKSIKAALCAMRIIRKVPELQENFLSRAKALLSDRNHGVLLTATTLIIEMCSINYETLQTFRKSLVSAGFSPEHDVTGVTDPFLQVKILKLLRILGKGDAEASEAMNDILAQNVGNSILYETVQTIMEIQSESGLRTLAINILGKFLTNRDNNIRYVALTTLNKTVSIDTNAVQRHRNIILDCLRDGDISIRRRALELSFALINESNVRVLTRELLAFLEVADNEFKPAMTTKICLAADRFAPNKRWHIDTVLRVLKLAGNYVREEILSNFIRLIAQTPDLNAYTVQKLYAALKADISQESLTLSGVWVIGEYGDILIKGGSFEEEELVKERNFQVTEKDVVDLMDSILAGPYANQVTREYILTALMKLTSRLVSTSVIHQIQVILEKYNTSIEVEIQQRAIEYSNLFKFENIRPAVLERMPVPEIKEENNRPNSLLDDGNSKNGGVDSLLDFSEDATNPKVSIVPETTQSTVDILADIFGGGGSTNTNSTITTNENIIPNEDIIGIFNSIPNINSNIPTNMPTQNIQQTNALDNLRLTGLLELNAPSVPSISSNLDVFSLTQPEPEKYVAYNKNGFKITLDPSKDSTNPRIINIRAIAQQMIRVSNPQQINIRLRLRISYTTSSGTKVDEVFDFNAFPQECW